MKATMGNEVFTETMCHVFALWKNMFWLKDSTVYSVGVLGCFLGFFKHEVITETSQEEEDFS